MLVAHASKHPQNRVPHLRHYLGRRRRWVTADLMYRLWPEGRWTAAEARWVADTFDLINCGPTSFTAGSSRVFPPIDQVTWSHGLV